MMPPSKDDAAGDMDHEIAEPGADRLLAALGEDQIGRGKRHAFPEQEQGQVVAGEHHAERAADVDESRHMLAGTASGAERRPCRSAP